MKTKWEWDCKRIFSGEKSVSEKESFGKTRGEWISSYVLVYSSSFLFSSRTNFSIECCSESRLLCHSLFMEVTSLSSSLFSIPGVSSSWLFLVLSFTQGCVRKDRLHCIPHFSLLNAELALFWWFSPIQDPSHCVLIKCGKLKSTHAIYVIFLVKGGSSCLEQRLTRQKNIVVSSIRFRIKREDNEGKTKNNTRKHEHRQQQEQDCVSTLLPKTMRALKEGSREHDERVTRDKYHKHDEAFKSRRDKTD